MGNVSWRGQASSEDTDSSLQGDQDEDTGKDTRSLVAHMGTWSTTVLLFFLETLTNGLNLALPVTDNGQRK